MNCFRKSLLLQKNYRIVDLLRIILVNQFLLLFMSWKMCGTISKQPKKPIHMEKPIRIWLR